MGGERTDLPRPKRQDIGFTLDADDLSGNLSRGDSADASSPRDRLHHRCPAAATNMHLIHIPAMIPIFMPW